MITTTAPAAPTLRARTRRAATTAWLIPAFLWALLLGVFEVRWTWPRTTAFAAVCWATAAAIVLVVTR